MNEPTLSSLTPSHQGQVQVQQAVENMLSALEKLEQALDQGDQRKAGAALYELHRELRNLLTLTQELDHERKP